MVAANADRPGATSTVGAVQITIPIPEHAVEEIVGLVLARLDAEPERRFLSKSALARHLGVTERRVKTLRERGLPARKIGRDLYFDVNEVSRFIDSEGELGRSLTLLDTGYGQTHERGSRAKRRPYGGRAHGD